MPVGGDAERDGAEAAFRAAMSRLGPWEAAPALAVGVSGGADSLALALLAQDWAMARGGTVLGLIVDHGLRAEATAEAAFARSTLAARGIPSRVLSLGLGAATAERARQARLAALEDACAEAGILHLLLAQHACDQAETRLIRTLDHSGPAGLAGMAAIRHGAAVRILRPLLMVPPAILRDVVRRAGLAWVRDPSNADPRATRTRLRHWRADRDGAGAATRALVLAARADGAARGTAEAELADAMARIATIRPEGFAVLSQGPWPGPVLARLMRIIGGRAFAPGDVAALAAAPRPATRAGVRLMRAGRLGPGWLLVRETAAPPVAALPCAIWDGRWRVRGVWPAGATIGALGDGPGPDLPAACRRVLPAIRHAGRLLAAGTEAAGFVPSDPAMGAPFLPSSGPEERAWGMRTPPGHPMFPVAAGSSLPACQSGRRANGRTG